MSWFQTIFDVLKLGSSKFADDLLNIGRKFDEQGLYGGLNAAQSGGQSGTNVLGNAATAQVQAGNDELGQAISGLDAQGVMDNIPAIEEAGNDAFSYSNIQGKSVEEKLEWLVNNDPENAQGWLEQLLGYQANHQEINDARAYDKMMSDTAVQRRMKDLEAAGINPILAVSGLTASGGGLASAGYPDSNVSTNAVSLAKDQNSNATKLGVAGITAIVSILAMLMRIKR